MGLAGDTRVTGAVPLEGGSHKAGGHRSGACCVVLPPHGSAPPVLCATLTGAKPVGLSDLGLGASRTMGQNQPLSFLELALGVWL